MDMKPRCWLTAIVIGLSLFTPLRGEDRAVHASQTHYFPPAESKGGWRSLLPAKGDPSVAEKSAIAQVGVNWDKLQRAWELAAQADGSTGLLVIRKGYIVGEWYKDADKNKAFNIYSSSKAYTSTAFGILLDEMQNGKTGRTGLTLDTKVCNAEWLPESLPLPDSRKADITLRHLLNMASGLGAAAVPVDDAPFETALGHTARSPFAKLKSDPGTAFNYSNAGVAHLVLLFRNAAGADLYPYLKDRLFDPTGVENLQWTLIGGKGHIGPLSQGYSGILTTPREHARFCYLALHKGEWQGRRLVPESYYDFALASSKAKPDYGAQWWVFPHHKDAPHDLVQTAGALNNHGYVVPSLDLVFIRLGDGKKFPDGYEGEIVRRVLAAVSPTP
jgi:CubicO group peptidase (beta-lactamase class C family)